MFVFGEVVKPNEKTFLNGMPKLVHLSQACLGDSRAGKGSFLQLGKEGEKSVYICSLDSQKVLNVALDLFIPTNDGYYLTVKGNNEVHVTGFYEPEDEMDDLEGLEDEEEASEAEVSDNELEEADAPQAQQAVPVPVDEDDDDDDDEDEEEDADADADEVDENDDDNGTDAIEVPDEEDDDDDDDDD
eukprot:CAMPEP_0113854376 /NCGR_PEP_ID=MMETSP0372-20130328/7275_1 /TAXON_ID=340204 /ORGANISM="Lankesteria abbotti" /LENGTH=186 /DNA_ID=CAMNT_0000827517 /DNA_START=35 /DNA_END=592 /DNA_ORIENTATION=+ /assembly_acc=CAM_ASM_000359